MEENKLKSIYASAIGATISIAATVAITIGGELSAPFKGWLKGLTGHHWITKSWLSLIVFILVFLLVRFLSPAPEAGKTRRAMTALYSWAIVASAILLLFFLYEFAKY